MTDNIVVLRLPQGQTRQRERKRGNETYRKKMQKFTEQPEAKRFIIWNVSKNGETDRGRKMLTKGGALQVKARKQGTNGGNSVGGWMKKGG